MAVSVKSEAEEAFREAWATSEELLGCVAGAIPVREFKFHPERRWKFDFAWPAIKLAVEIEGQGRHQTFVGFRRDCDKYNAALAMGWRVLRFPAADKKASKSRQEWPGGAADWALATLEVMCDVR
jgi:very-short-patch-repair endonuclease